MKAFSYGHDALAVSKTLQSATIDYLAVAYTEEGIYLRENGITLPILVLHAQIQNYELLIEHNLEPNIYSKKTLNSFLKSAKEKQCSHYPIHLKFNTGLNRLGFTKTDVEYITDILKENEQVHINSIFSHLAASEDANERDFTHTQIDKFKNIIEKVTKEFPYKIDLHLSNTSGIINYPEAHFDMVRLGIGMYGFGNETAETAQLKNIGTLKTIISQIHEVRPGESSGYNRAYIAKKRTKTATIPIGHADGISRRLGNGNGSVKINGHMCPIVGNVCMDMLMVDVTNINCNEGDEVVLFDSQEMLNELARKSGTISYEILTGISQRIARKIVS